jgi:hypothetical protein
MGIPPWRLSLLANGTRRMFLNTGWLWDPWGAQEAEQAPQESFDPLVRFLGYSTILCALCSPLNARLRQIPASLWHPRFVARPLEESL